MVISVMLMMWSHMQETLNTDQCFHMCSICLLFPSELEILHMFITQEFVTNCFDNYEEFIYKIYTYS